MAPRPRCSKRLWLQGVTLPRTLSFTRFWPQVIYHLSPSLPNSPRSISRLKGIVDGSNNERFLVLAHTQYFVFLSQPWRQTRCILGCAPTSLTRAVGLPVRLYICNISCWRCSCLVQNCSWTWPWTMRPCMATGTPGWTATTMAINCSSTSTTASPGT